MLRIAVARIGDLPADDAAAPAWMGDDEQRRWAAGSAVARREFSAGRALVRELLRAATGVPADEWRVSARAGSAPVVRVGHAATCEAGVHASLSHRLGWVAAAVSEAVVGIDLECARPTRSDPVERASLMLSSAERPGWNALAPEQRESALLTRWTVKEAWFKATPAQASAWDFRQVVARACAPAQANVRAWSAAPLHVAICCADADELARVECEGLDAAVATSTFWHVARAAQAD
jgi:phosphopantetheinyl transferase